MKYLNEIKNNILIFDPTAANRYFLFGSFVKDKKFHDIDLGVVGNAKSRKNLSELREEFYDSAIPYKIDVVDIDEADLDFKNHVLNEEKVVWLKLK